MKKYLLALCLILISQLASGQVLTSPGGTTFTGGTVANATTFQAATTLSTGTALLPPLLFGNANSGMFVGTGYGSNVLIGRDVARNVAHVAGDSGWGNVFIGDQAGLSATSDYYNVGIGIMAMQVGNANRFAVALGNSALLNATNTYDNMAIGSESLLMNVSGNRNTAVGHQAGYGVTGNSFSYSSLIGYRAGYSLRTGTDNVTAIGAFAGAYETAGNKLFIDGLDRTTEAAGRTNSLIYGVMNATPASQTLNFNVGSVSLPASSYLNFGATAGTTGYGWFDSAGTLKFKHSGGAWAALSAPSTSGNIMKSDGTDWTSSNSLSIATLDMTSSTSSVPWLVNASTATVTTEGAAHWESDTDILSIGDGATKVSLDFTANTIYTFPSVTASLAPLTSPAFTTPTLGAATATSVLATGIVDGTAPIVITATTANYQVGATYKSGYTFLNPTSSSGANSALLPTAAAGLQYCIGNYTAKTGTLTIKTAVGTQTIDLDGVMTANTGAVQATAVAGNLACFVGLDGSVWKAIPTKGVWTRIARP